jgi:hypothetical protein
MLNIEDFFQNQEKQLELSMNRHNAFIDEVESQILNQSFIFFPDYADQRAAITEHLQDELNENLLSFDETIEYLLLFENKSEQPNPSKFIVPPKHQFETAQQELEFELSKISPPHPEEFIIEMQEIINEEREKNEFLFAIHNKIIQTAFKHFPEIIELSGNSIRNINFFSYAFAISYTESFYDVIWNF